MDLKTRINAFVRLRDILEGYTFNPENINETSGLDKAFLLSIQANGWFTPDNLNFSFSSILDLLRKDNLEKWLNQYPISDHELKKNVAVIMAGNIPMVGFHDFVCVLISGNNFIGKLSSDDKYLLPALAGILQKIEPGFNDKIVFTEDRLNSFDAVIATGSNNSAGYFKYYFSKYPHIIRKNRKGAAILTGQETSEELIFLADDVFLYFGLGCRNVSKIFLPKGYDLTKLQYPFQLYEHLYHHHKFNNNYTYQKAILQLNGVPFIDAGFFILKENEGISSPVAVVYYEFYESLEELFQQLLIKEDQIQCVVTKTDFPLRKCSFGKAQHPGLRDYADGIDTIDFLLKKLK